MVLADKYQRVVRAIENFHDHLDYEHTVVLSEETRLNWNQAFEWCVEEFGEPGERWDFYYEHEHLKNERSKWIGWADTFGFSNSEDATLFVLRWT